MIANVVDGGNNGNSVVLDFNQKVKIIETYISSTDGWQKIAQSIKNVGGSARAQSLSIFRKIAENRSATSTEVQEIFNKLVATLDEHLSRI